MKFTSINDITEIWQDQEGIHRLIAETLYNQTNEVPEYKALRDYVETNSYGHGERCMYKMWELIIQELPQDFIFAEIGCHRGQQLALVQLICDLKTKVADIIAISPFNGDGGFESRDYHRDITSLFVNFNLDYSLLFRFEGSSTDENVIEKVTYFLKHAGDKSIDALFIDGSHTYDDVTSDLKNYAPLIKQGGFLVLDDCCNDYALPQGYFGGIETVTRAVNDWEKTQTDFEFLFSVSHNKVYQKKTSQQINEHNAIR